MYFQYQFFSTGRSLSKHGETNNTILAGYEANNKAVKIQVI